MPQPGSATQDSQNSPCVTSLWPLTSSSGFPERSSTWVSNIYVIYLHSRPLKSLRAPAAGQGCVHKAKCKCVNALKTESGHELPTTGPRSGHATARTLAIVQPRTPVAYSHAPSGRAPLGGGGEDQGGALGVPGWVGEGQHVRGRCGLISGVRDVSGLQVYSMTCVCGGGGSRRDDTRDMRRHMPVWGSCA